MLFFSFNKDKNLFAALTKVAILKTKLLAGNDHVIDIYMENISGKYPLLVKIPVSHCVCIFSISLSTI